MISIFGLVRGLSNMPCHDSSQRLWFHRVSHGYDLQQKGEINMQHRLGRVSQLVLSLVLLIVLLSSAGCIGLTANLIKAWTGMVVDAEFDELIGKRVAVVCLSDTASFGPGPIGDELAIEVAYLLKTSVDGIAVVHQQEIDDWKDENDWDQIDFREIGRGVGADMVIAINLHALSLRDGATMFRGQSEAEVVVYDNYVGPGYGEPSDGMIEASKLLAKKEAILLDPVYSGKGFAGLIDLIRNKKFTKNDNVLFIHTGGAVSLFAYEWAFNE
mgnify:CR=1 FL=1